MADQNMLWKMDADDVPDGHPRHSLVPMVPRSGRLGGKMVGTRQCSLTKSRESGLVFGLPSPR